MWSEIRQDQRNGTFFDMDRADGRGIVGNNIDRHNARNAHSLQLLKDEVMRVRSEDSSRRILVVSLPSQQPDIRLMRFPS